jgi:hypothetical protein
MATEYRNNVFMLEDLAQYDDGITDLALRALSGNESEGR